MGTRSLTFVYNDIGRRIVNIYRQYDGYPSGQGKDLAQVLTTTRHNGMGCMAASLISKLKEEPYNIYIYPVDATNCGQEYEYHIYEDHVRVIENGVRVIENSWDNPDRTIFDGSWAEFLDFCSDAEAA